jgi:hypothetical protein
VTGISKCNGTCPFYPIKVKTIDEKNKKIWNVAGTPEPYTIKKTKLGTGAVCTNQNSVCIVKCPYFYDDEYNVSNLGGICPYNYELTNNLFCINKYNGSEGKLVCNKDTKFNKWRCLPDCDPGYTFDPVTDICSPTIK